MAFTFLSQRFFYHAKFLNILVFGEIAFLGMKIPRVSLPRPLRDSNKKFADTGLGPQLFVKELFQDFLGSFIAHHPIFYFPFLLFFFFFFFGCCVKPDLKLVEAFDSRKCYSWQPNHARYRQKLQTQQLTHGSWRTTFVLHDCHPANRYHSMVPVADSAHDRRIVQVVHGHMQEIQPVLARNAVARLRALQFDCTG